MEEYSLDLGGRAEVTQGNDAGQSEVRREIAPWWHTAALTALLLAWAALTTPKAQAAEGTSHVARYASMVMMEWMLLGATVAGVYDRSQFFFETLWKSARSWMLEVLRAVGIYVAMIVSALFLAYCFWPSLRMSFRHDVQASLAPHGALQMLAWVGVSLSAGICEELVFRGYLLQQCMAWGRALRLPNGVASSAAVIATSLLFGSLHLYQGVGGALVIAMTGVVFAVAALYFGNLRAAILAHALLDILSGFMMH